ncbi:MAG TPA: hypothetical protein VKY31_04285, partial [Terriglobia bacterium]|nr:hypothetical protein [Terriglobia bacterium]
MRTIGSKFGLFLFAFLLIQAGCIKRTRVIPKDQRLLPAKSASKEDLFRTLEEQSRAIHTLKGTITLDASGGGSQSGVLTEYRQTSGYLFVERPQNIRIKVLAPLVYSTVADMVSNGREYRLSIPVNNQWFEADVDTRIESKSPIANLRPQHFLAGLFVDITAYAGKPQVKYLFNEQTE